jgi:guanosine-3',5'-bis(diphosphate) 3'-pyrophosphohydrolase
MSTATDYARSLAQWLHRNQTRFNGEPYCRHPERVADIVYRSPEWEHAETVERDELLICALLHDAIEDTDYTVKNAQDDFGGVVAEALVALTHFAGESYPLYLRRVSDNPIAVIVKRSDIADNISTLPYDRTRLWAKYVEALSILAAHLSTPQEHE